jgi:hypothetical protein
MRMVPAGHLAVFCVGSVAEALLGVNDHTIRLWPDCPALTATSMNPILFAQCGESQPKTVTAHARCTIHQ